MKTSGQHAAGSRQQGEGGWTLIELMISVAVVGFIMSSVALIVYIGVKSWNLQKDRLGMSQDSRTAAEIISSQLRMGSIQSVVISSSDVGGNTVDFSSLSFKRYDYKGTTWDTRFYLEQLGANSPAHLVFSTPMTDEATTITTRQDKVLISGVTSLFFTYPDTRNPAKIEMNLSLSRSSWQGRILTQQVREVIDVRNP